MTNRRTTTVALLGVLAVGTMSLTGCGPKMEEQPATVEQGRGWKIPQHDISTFVVTLPSGDQKECVAVTYSGSSLQCWDYSE